MTPTAGHQRCDQVRLLSFTFLSVLWTKVARSVPISVRGIRVLGPTCLTFPRDAEGVWAENTHDETWDCADPKIIPSPAFLATVLGKCHEISMLDDGDTGRGRLGAGYQTKGTQMPHCRWGRVRAGCLNSHFTSLLLDGPSPQWRRMWVTSFIWADPFYLIYANQNSRRLYMLLKPNSSKNTKHNGNAKEKQNKTKHTKWSKQGKKNKTMKKPQSCTWCIANCTVYTSSCIILTEEQTKRTL